MELNVENGDLKQRVETLLQSPFETLMKDPRVCDMFYDVFGRTLCRACRSDRKFAYEKLKQYLIDGKTEI
jgi:hypothetical protein